PEEYRDTPAAGGVDLRAMLGRSGSLDDRRDSRLDRRLDQTAFAHPALFAVEYALAGLWQDWGIVPKAVVGYSLGEYVAACVAGVFSLEDALLLIARRAQMIEELPAGAMLAVPLAGEALHGLLGPDLSSDLAIAAVNGPQLSVVAGPAAAVTELESRLAAQGLACRRLRTGHAFHCGLMEPVAERLTRLVAGVTRQAPSIPCLSNVTGTWLRPEEATDPGYWARHLLGTVRFADNLAELWDEPGRIMLEVGPGQSLASLALQHPASAAQGFTGPLALHSLAAAYERQDDQATLLTTLGRLWLAGVRVDWRRFYDGERRLHAALPTYPFERQRYWFDGIEESAFAPESRTTAQARAPQNTTSVHARPNLANVYVAPETDLERGIARLWQELLGVEQVGVHDSFFALGGHSLLASQVISRLVDSLGVELSLEQIFEAPTIAELAGVIAAADLSPEAVPPSRTPIPRRPDPGSAPLSFAQQRLWFIDQIEAGTPLYNVPAPLRAEGPLDVRVLALCLDEIVRRHETLRTVFGVRDGSPVQVIRPATLFELPVVDLTALPESRREALGLALAGEEGGRPFDLARDAQLRATLLRLAEGDHIIALTLHHIVCDSWSISILIREVMALYAAFAQGRPSPLPELPVQYADYAVWQRSWLQGAILEAEIAFWREQLAG
ncbi:MAG TPA: condensation domain-containing protein, partial [Thermoanaerobaculia bacterium]|nr:condensation domain-containing protein [Thermoanaerobaculia bacterium]